MKGEKEQGFTILTITYASHNFNILPLEGNKEL